MTKVLATLTLATIGCATPARTVERVVATPHVTPEPSPVPHRTVARAAAPDTETPAAAPGPSGDVERLILAQFGTKAGPRAVRIAKCESHLNPRAVSRDGAVGIFQVMPRYHAWRVRAVGGSSLFDVATNVKVAHHIWLEQGFAPWTCRGAA